MECHRCWQVYFPCWNSSAEIVDWMEARGQGRTQADFLQLWADYQSTALRTLDEEVGNSNTPIILWSSHLTEPGVIESFLNKDRWDSCRNFWPFLNLNEAASNSDFPCNLCSSHLAQPDVTVLAHEGYVLKTAVAKICSLWKMTRKIGCLEVLVIREYLREPPHQNCV